MKKIAYTLLAAGLGLSTAKAAVDIADAPLFLTPRVDPNILFMLDDSASMQLEVLTGDDIPSYARFVYPWDDPVYSASGGSHTNRVPSFYNLDGLAQLVDEDDLEDLFDLDDDDDDGGLFGSLGLDDVIGSLNDDDDDEIEAALERLLTYSAYYRSPQTNALYYNPSITYRPWVKADGTRMPQANPEAAFHNPLMEGKGSRDLTSENSQKAEWTSCIVVAQAKVTGCKKKKETRQFWPAVYYWHDSDSSVSLSESYTRVKIHPEQQAYEGHGRAERTDCAAGDGSCSYAEEIQNFANWYTYYRSRVLAARAGIGAAFAEQAENLRVGFSAINSEPGIIRGVRPFQGQDREAFFTSLYGHEIPYKGTPLRKGLQAAGKYYETDEPWRADPGVSTPDESFLSCRSNYTILMTDGYWSGGDPGVGNVDGNAGATITDPDGATFTYSPTDPYQDSHSKTLADVAMHYWNRDLRSDLTNNVPTSAANEAFWQHMVTFGVGLGVQGSIDPDEAWSAVNNRTPIAWPKPKDSDAGKIDDLLHAAVNGRGGFFSAADPIGFSQGFDKVLETIVARTESSATAAGVSAAVLQGDTLLYAAGFRSTDWSGSFKAYKLDAKGELNGVAWDAEEKLAARTPADRTIVTQNSATGSAVAFEYASLSPAQQAALNHAADDSLDNRGTQRVAWLRGDDAADASFRRRRPAGALRLLGDVVNADPTYMGHQDYGYSLLDGAEGTRYIAFRDSEAYKNRPEVMFLGANDGMLHAFDASDDATGGGELFAYLPGELLLPESGKQHAPVSRLMAPDYAHRYLVDGVPAVGDAYLDTGSGKQWHSVLVGTLGVGGRSVFALDVTAPDSFGASDVLWEFTDPALGRGVTQPIIVRLANGDWAAVFGNGYNSQGHTGVLFVVDLASGSLIRKIDTGVGSVDTPNGLAPPTATDAPRFDRTAQYAYAGDLLGNLWRFDLSSSNEDNWSATRVFTAADDAGQAQPITVVPRLASYSGDPHELMVLFGTGSYFRDQDAILTSPQVQSLYGIQDRFDSSASVARADLRKQSILWQGDGTLGDIDYRLRETSRISLSEQNRGWYLDLAVSGEDTVGERVVSEATFPAGSRIDRVRFTTLIPDNDPCAIGRTGYVMDLMVADGSRNEASVFDLNRDGAADTGDELPMTENGETVGRIISGVGFGTGERITTLRQMNSPLELIYSGDPGNTDTSPGGRPLLGKEGEGQRGRLSWRQIR